jgi:hypothetical protein
MKKAFVIIMAIVFCFSNQLFAQQTKRVYIFQKNSSGDPVGDLENGKEQSLHKIHSLLVHSLTFQLICLRLLKEIKRCT